MEFQDALPQRVKEIAEKGNVSTPEDAMVMPKAKLMQLRGCTEHDVAALKQAAAKMVLERARPVMELLTPECRLKWSRVSFGCAALDKCTGGGVITRGISEICGAAGVGKTQLLLQLSLTVQLPLELGGLGKSVAYICTENVFPSKRLLQMAKVFAARYPAQKVNFLGNIYIEHVIESEDLLICVTQRLRKLVENLNIGLIVIDSVAAVYRVQTNYIQRAQNMRKLANCLLDYAHKFNCAVIGVNQVASDGDAQNEIPCLGLAWAHLGRTRYRVSKVPKQLMVHKQLHTVRRFEVMYSPETPNEFAEFLITEHGVVDVP